MKRLFARIVVKIDNVNFKYNQDNCLNCWADRVDKILVIDPLAQQTPQQHSGLTNLKRFKTNVTSSRICICKENSGHFNFPVTLTSQGEEAEVVMKV